MSKSGRRRKNPPMKRRVMGDVTESMTTRDIPREIRYIMELAERGQGRVVGQSPVVFFSTETRDAWMLDMEDGFALPLVRDGERLSIRILDSDSNTAIEWTHDFEIEGETMLFSDQRGHLRAVEGYPVRQIIEIDR